jgi:hypothetical protein
MPQTIPLLTLTLVRMWYEELSPWDAKSLSLRILAVLTMLKRHMLLGIVCFHQVHYEELPLSLFWALVVFVCLLVSIMLRHTLVAEM